MKIVMPTSRPAKIEPPCGASAVGHTPPEEDSRTPVRQGRGGLAFSLIEIIVVIGITAILFFLLLGPLINSFRLTQRAQMLTAAQNAARITLENLSRELGSASYVFDNTSHPFQVAMPSSQASGIPDVDFSNFLILDTVKQNANPSGTPTTVPAAAFYAKLDFVLPRHNSSGQIVDPTTDEPIIVNKNGSVAPTGVTFPLAPGTTIVRYFIGLRDPSKHYGTQGEGPLLARSGDNTYVLYRAQFQPYLTSTNVGGNTSTTPNTDLFTTYKDSSGNIAPEFDDPDFFRYVTPQVDTNWLNASHQPYTAVEAYGAGGSMTNPMPGSHNYRVQKWFQIAKPVINSPNIDLVLLPHNRDGSINYDVTNASYPRVYESAHSGIVHDPVTGEDWPTVNPSVSFKYASISSDASASTTLDNAAQGFGGDAAAANNGLPFLPAVYTATDQSWAFPYHISLYPSNNTGSPLYDTTVAQADDATQMYLAGDLLEMYEDPSASNNPVYDISSNKPTPTGSAINHYVPMTVNPDTSTISFDTPAVPDPANPYDRFYKVPISLIAQSNGFIDLSLLKVSYPAGALASPLPNVPLDPTAPLLPVTAPQVANARIVPGSVRVYGPDAYPGPSSSNPMNFAPVLYNEVFPGNAVGPQDNQFQVDYAHNALLMYVSDLAPFIAVNPNATVQISFNYQSNMLPVDASQPVSYENPASPYRVKVDYQTRDLLDVNIGVRVYDPNNVGPAQIVTVHNQVRIGNSNR